MLLTKRTHFALLSLVALLQAPGIFAMQQQVEWKKAAQQTAQAMSLNADDEAMLEAPAAKQQKLSPGQERADADVKAALAMQTTEQKAWGTLARLPADARGKIMEFAYHNKWTLKEAWLKKTVMPLGLDEGVFLLDNLSATTFIIQERGAEDILALWDNKKYQQIAEAWEGDSKNKAAIATLTESTFALGNRYALEIWQHNDSIKLEKIAQVGGYQGEDDHDEYQYITHLIKLSRKRLVSGHEDGALRFWDISDIRQPKLETTIQRAAPHTDLIRMSDTVFVRAAEPQATENPHTKYYFFEVWDISKSTENPVASSGRLINHGDEEPVLTLLPLSETELIAALSHNLYILNITHLTKKPVAAFPTVINEPWGNSTRLSEITVLTSTVDTIAIWDISNKQRPELLTQFHLVDEMQEPKVIKLTDGYSFAFCTDEGINFYAKDAKLWDMVFKLAPMDQIRLQWLLSDLRRNLAEKRVEKRKVTVDWNWYMNLPDILRKNIESHLGIPPFSVEQVKAAQQRALRRA